MNSLNASTLKRRHLFQEPFTFAMIACCVGYFDVLFNMSTATNNRINMVKVNLLMRFYRLFADIAPHPVPFKDSLIANIFRGRLCHTCLASHYALLVRKGTCCIILFKMFLLRLTHFLRTICNVSVLFVLLAWFTSWSITRVMRGLTIELVKRLFYSAKGAYPYPFLHNFLSQVPTQRYATFTPFFRCLSSAARVTGTSMPIWHIAIYGKICKRLFYSTSRANPTTRTGNDTDRGFCLPSCVCPCGIALFATVVSFSKIFYRFLNATDTTNSGESKQGELLGSVVYLSHSYTSLPNRFTSLESMGVAIACRLASYLPLLYHNPNNYTTHLIVRN